MDLDEISELVKRVVIEIQDGSGRVVVIITDESCPIGGLEGFDSLNAVEASCLLSDYMECEVPNNIMLSKSPERQLSINEIAERLHQFVKTKGG